MFPLAHIYVTSRVGNSDDPKLLMGAILPDIAETSWGKVAGRILAEPEEFYILVNKKYPKWRQLAVGVLSHCDNSGGADYYSDNEKIGFTKKVARQYKSEIEEVMGKSKDEIIFGHTLVEVGIDLNLLEDDNQVWQQYKSCWDQAKIEDISEIVADFSGDSPDLIAGEIKKLKVVFSPSNYRIAALLSKGRGMAVIAKIVGWSKYGRSLELVEEMRQMVRPEYLNWLNQAVMAMKREFKSLLI